MPERGKRIDSTSIQGITRPRLGGPVISKGVLRISREVEDVMTNRLNFAGEMINLNLGKSKDVMDLLSECQRLYHQNPQEWLRMIELIVFGATDTTFYEAIKYEGDYGIWADAVTAIVEISSSVHELRRRT